MDTNWLDTHQKAVQINLDNTKYGTFAEGHAKRYAAVRNKTASKIARNRHVIAGSTKTRLCACRKFANDWFPVEREFSL